LIGPEANLNLGNLNSASLGSARLYHADLSRANLGDAILTNANLSNANLTNANLTNANLSSADLSRVNLEDADLTGSNLTAARYWENAYWTDAYYYADNVPTWGSGMDQAWRDSEGILAIDPTSGDFNSDGDFDAADYTLWQDNLGLDASVLNGNGSGAATVVHADYLLWKTNFGQSSASGSGADHVPEPTTLLLALLALAAVPLRVRHG